MRLVKSAFLWWIIIVLSAGCSPDERKNVESDPGPVPYPLTGKPEEETIIPFDQDSIGDAEKDTRLAGWPEEVRGRLRSVARVTVEVEGLLKKDNYTGMGSGTLFREDLILTALHIFPQFEDLILSKNLAVQVFIDNKIIRGFIPNRSYLEPASDLAAIKLRERTRLAPIPLAKNGPEIGSTLYTLGFAFINRPLALDLRFKGAAWSGGKVYLVVSRSFEHGYSGSPLLNFRGELIGLNNAITQKGVFGLAVPLEDIRKFMEGIR